MVALLSLWNPLRQLRNFIAPARFRVAAEGYRSLAEGARVSYEEEQCDKGPKAVQVTKL